MNVGFAKYFSIRKLHSSIISLSSRIKQKKITACESIKELELSYSEKATKKCSYVFSASIARKIVRSILCNRSHPTAPVIEISPGIGLVSKHFLKQNVEQVIGLEMDKTFYPYLQSIQDEYGKERFEYVQWNMLNIYEKFNPSLPSNESNVSYDVNELLVRNRLLESDFYDKETPYSIIKLGGSQENRDFVFYILRNLPSEDPILCKNRVEFFFLVHPKFKTSVEEMLPIQKPSNYTRYYSYFHTFVCLMYDINFIEEFESTDFVPSFSKRGLSRKIDSSKRYLARMQLKPNISSVLPLDQHFAFSIFLRHIFRKRKIRIVPVMETLVSGCGLHMLASGFTMMETVADVSPLRLLQLYKRMLLWPEYSVSHLKNHILMKTQGGPMEEEDML